MTVASSQDDGGHCSSCDRPSPTAPTVNTWQIRSITRRCYLPEIYPRYGRLKRVCHKYLAIRHKYMTSTSYAGQTTTFSKTPRQYRYTTRRLVWHYFYPHATTHQQSPSLAPYHGARALR